MGGRSFNSTSGDFGGTLLLTRQAISAMLRMFPGAGLYLQHQFKKHLTPKFFLSHFLIRFLVFEVYFMSLLMIPKSFISSTTSSVLSGLIFTLGKTSTDVAWLNIISLQFLKLFLAKCFLYPSEHDLSFPKTALEGLLMGLDQNLQFFQVQ